MAPVAPLGRTLLAAIFSALILTGCAEPDPLAPPTVYFGEDVCDVCAMIISDERFVAAAITRRADEHSTALFDDIGCLLAFEEDDPEADIVARYARDYDTLSWLAMEAAVYVSSRELRTPMAFGVAASTDHDSARALLARYPGRELDLDELRTQFRAGTLLMIPEEASP